MCLPSLEGKKLIMDCAHCPHEMFSSQCISSHLKTISSFQPEWLTTRYEEEITIDFEEQDTKCLQQYVILVREIENLMADPKTFGMVQDENYPMRVKHMKEIYENLFIDPRKSIEVIESYSESIPSKGIFLEGYQRFAAIRKAILKALKELELLKRLEKKESLRELFLQMAKLKPYEFVEMLLLPFPQNAKPLEDPESVVQLPYGIVSKVYDLVGSEANLYVVENPHLTNIPAELVPYIKYIISEGMKEFSTDEDLAAVYDNKTREYRNLIMEKARKENIKLTPEQALALGRECASWAVGLGAPLENISLDRENITDIYIDAQNSPIYIEHRKFGLCHTLYRYNSRLLEQAFRNIVLFSMEKRKFDEKNPVVDVVLKRLSMRCHLQRPPATYSELQAALRIMRPLPFTYCQYLNYHAMTPFFAGYDDLMISLGCSEAVLGLKGVGKTSFTAAKIAAIGTKMRILPIQDIEEIPVKAYRKRGFHIGAMRVQSSDIEGLSLARGTELDLLSMANASLRMGDACIIINEIRSRTTIQGVINILNTQPGVFILYNLHAQSLRDVQDRLELVFGIPAASMFATERYSFLKKISYGRQKTVYRLLGEAYETNPETRTFDMTFGFRKGKDIQTSQLDCLFLKNQEANSWTLERIDFAKLEKNLNFVFEPPVMRKRASDNGVNLEEYVMQAFFKAKTYYDITEVAKKLGAKKLLEIDFVLKVNSEANKMLAKFERENGSIDYASFYREWLPYFKNLVKQELLLLQHAQKS